MAPFDNRTDGEHVYQVEVVKLNALQLILVGTMLEAVTFCLQVPTGALADLYSRRFCIIAGYLLIGASYLLQSLVPLFEAILLAQALLGAGYSFVSGAEEAWVADEIGESQAGKVFLRATQMSEVGRLSAIPLSFSLKSHPSNSTGIRCHDGLTCDAKTGNHIWLFHRSAFAFATLN